MATSAEQKTQIDTNITNKTTVNSITPTILGDELKSIIDYVDSRILKTKVSLTADQINNIGTTPIEAIPAPGANKFINIINSNAVLIWNTTPYSNSSLTLSNTNASPWYFTFNVLLGQTEDTVAIGTRNGTPLAAINAPVLIGGTDSVAVGDSTIDVYITYEIITL